MQEVHGQVLRREPQDGRGLRQALVAPEDDPLRPGQVLPEVLWLPRRQDVYLRASDPEHVHIHEPDQEEHSIVYRAHSGLGGYQRELLRPTHRQHKGLHHLRKVGQ